MATSKNKVGERFDNIVLVEDTGKRTKNSGGIIWKCKCDCGRTFERSIASIKYSIKHGHTVSCGCVQRKKTSEWDIGNKFAHDKERKDKARDSLGQIEGTTMQGILFRKKVNKNNNTGHRGVSYEPKTGTYRARIMVARKDHSVRNIKTLEQAIKIRKQLEDKYYKPIIERWLEEHD